MPHRQKTFFEVNKLTAGRFKNYYEVWGSITTNLTVLSWIKGYKIPLTGIPVQNKPHELKITSPKDHTLVVRSIKELLILGVIVPCEYTRGQFVSSILLADKSNGKKGFILNLNEFNKYIDCPHFKMEDYRTASKLVQKNSFLATIDLKDA